MMMDDDEDAPDPEAMAKIFGSPKPRLPIEKGPFYAIKLKMFHENAVGGMTIDENTNVVRPDGTPIAGLYACGDNTRGIMLPGDVGVQYIETYLSAMTYAMCSGYLAAEKAIEFVEG